ncbi:hypothetical protein [Streptococcus pacificus]|uniref:DUF2975 domain-containing protein n=1 Tax=Streptococcus pacificus TaxID=2740577 RepID=A0ABS0ZJR7_9STRE|nr:hypothetical protein [Streptococcus pacificus]MBJ8326254.1 hypothetical protein [Streptococcus pacificus]
MKSLTKIRQAIRTSTIAIICINIFAMVVSVLTTWGMIVSLNNIDQIALTDPVLADTIKGSATPTFFISIIIAIIVLIVISFLCFQNLKRLKQNEMVKKLPYYIGIGYYLINIAASLVFMLSANQMSMPSLIVQFVLIALYSFTLYKVTELENNTTQEETQEI